MNDEPNYKNGDRVQHADCGDAVATFVRYSAYPMAIVRWESTGRESSVNRYYLTPVTPMASVMLDKI